MKLKMIGLLVACMFVCSIGSYAQLNTFEVKGIPTFSKDSISASGDTLMVLKCKIVLPDTNSVEKIFIKIGTTIHGNEVIDTCVSFDDLASLPVGFQYERSGNEIFLTLGYYMPLMYYLDVRLKDVFGTTSNVKSAIL